MLPTLAEQHKSPERLFAVIGNSKNIFNRFNALATSVFDKQPDTWNEAKIFSMEQLQDVVLFDAQDVNFPIIESCDGALFITSTQDGIGSELSKVWQFCRDNDIPRMLAIQDVFKSYTDFEEVVAISHRVLQPDILIRYLPIADEDEESLIGIYDVLTNRIHEYSSGTSTIRAGDSEHESLTNDHRQTLIDALAISTFTDTELEMHQAGITLPIETYETAWCSPHICSALPLEDTSGLELILSWLNHLPARWVPTFVNDGWRSEREIPSNFRHGIGIVKGFARMWGARENQLSVASPVGEESSSNKVMKVALNVNDRRSSCLVDDAINSGDTIVSAGINLELRAPLF